MSTSVAWPVRPPPALAPCRYVYLAPPVPRGRAEEHRASHTGGALSLPRTRLTPPPEALPRGGRRLRDRRTRAVALAAPRDAHSPAPGPPSAAPGKIAPAMGAARDFRPATSPPGPTAAAPRLAGVPTSAPGSIPTPLALPPRQVCLFDPQPPSGAPRKIGPAITGGARFPPRHLAPRGPPPPPHASPACPPRLRGPYPRLPPSLLARCDASTPQPPWARR